jgi:hypothetical protein
MLYLIYAFPKAPFNLTQDCLSFVVDYSWDPISTFIKFKVWIIITGLLNKKLISI